MNILNDKLQYCIVLSTLDTQLVVATNFPIQYIGMPAYTTKDTHVIFVLIEKNYTVVICTQCTFCIFCQQWLKFYGDLVYIHIMKIEMHTTTFVKLKRTKQRKHFHFYDIADVEDDDVKCTPLFRPNKRKLCVCPSGRRTDRERKREKGQNVSEFDALSSTKKKKKKDVLLCRKLYAVYCVHALLRLSHHRMLTRAHERTIIIHRALNMVYLLASKGLCFTRLQLTSH